MKRMLLAGVFLSFGAASDMGHAQSVQAPAWSPNTSTASKPATQVLGSGAATTLFQKNLRQTMDKPAAKTQELETEQTKTEGKSRELAPNTFYRAMPDR